MGFDSREEYLQRVGRTGRAGKSGTAYLITAPEENAGVNLVCDVLTDLYADAPDKPVCAMKAQPTTFSTIGIKYPQPPAASKAKAAKVALGGWLGALASKWKRLKMTPEAVVSLAQKQSLALGLGEIPIDKLYDKLSIKVKAVKAVKAPKK
jgi:hypothetical protein